MLDLRAQHRGIAGEVEAAIARVVASQQFIGGPEVAAFESALADYGEVAHAVACASGSDAILLALQALGVGPGDRVVCPALTFFSTASAIVRLGAEPVFADVAPDGLCLDVESLRSAVERAGTPAAVIAVHLYGRAAPLSALLAECERLGAPLVEDAAQAIGARDDTGRPVGSRGRIGCLSFYPTKNLGGHGDGGMLLTQDAALAERLRGLRNHGATPGGLHTAVGINSRLDAVQAAVLAAKLPHLDAWTDRRQANAAVYQAGLVAAGAGLGGGDFAALALPLRLPTAPPPPARHVFHQYVIRVPAAQRDRLRAHLARDGIDSGCFYSPPLHEQPCFARAGAARPSLPVSEAAARESLAIPIHAELSPEQLARVIRSLGGGLAR